MSWWTNLRDAAESVVSTVTPLDIRSDRARREKSGVTGAANKVRSAEVGLFNKVTGRPTADDKRSQNKLVSDQINAYKEQTELTRKQLNETRNATDAERRRVQEKQIRSLRRNYRSQNSGMLGQGQPASQDMSAKLGG